MADTIADLPLVAGHVALDLVNTVEPRFRVDDRHEHLDSPAALVTWATRSELVSNAEARRIADAWRPSPRSATRSLREVLDLREALYATLLTQLDGTRPHAREIDAHIQQLMSRWASAAGRSTLEFDEGHGVVARLVVGTAPAQLIADRVAHSAVELLCQVDLTHLRACPPAEGGCGWLFIDRSRNSSRRWCLMDSACGNQAKARRLNERRRAARAAARKPAAR